MEKQSVIRITITRGDKGVYWLTLGKTKDFKSFQKCIDNAFQQLEKKYSK